MWQSSMNQVVFVILSVIFLNVIDGQILTPCQRAEQNLAANQLCVNASIDANNATLVCNGTCRDLYDAVIGVCGGTQRYKNAIFSLCDPCGIAQTAQSSNENCTNALFRRIPADLCMGTCRELIDNIIQNCPNTSTHYTNALDQYCTPCGTAVRNIELDFDCWVTFTNFEPDPAVICTETCLALAGDVIDNCNSSISSNYVNVISDICTGDIDPNLACEAAADAVDDSCLQLLNSANPTVCSGMCATQVSMVVTTCASISDPEIEEFIAAYNTACRSGANCAAALTAWNANTTCIDAVNDDDAATYCSGTCGELIGDVFFSCASNNFLSNYYKDCGFGTSSGSGSVLQASGIFTLLITAILALKI